MISDRDFTADRIAIADLLQVLGASLSTFGLETEASRASELVAKVDAVQPASVVVIVGEFNTGKSMLANALCRLDILPTGIVPTTATLNSVTYGLPERIIIRYCDGRIQESPLNPEALKQLTARFGDHTDVDRVDIVSQGIPDGVVLVDTPGVNDINETRADIVYGTMLSADSVVMVMDAQQPMKQSEISFLRRGTLANSLIRTNFVLNHIDRLATSEQLECVVRYTRQQLSTLYLDVAADLRKLGNSTTAVELEKLAHDIPLYCISAKQLLAARIRRGRLNGDALAFTRYFESLSDSTVREERLLSRIVIQSAALSATLRRQIDLQKQLKTVEQNRLVDIAAAQADTLEQQIKTAKALIRQLDTQGTRLTQSSQERIRSAFHAAIERLDSPGAVGPSATLCRDMERDLARHVETIVHQCNTELQEMSRAAVAAIAMQVAASSVAFNMDGDAASSGVGDYLARFLSEPQNQMLVLLVGPFVIWSLGWLGVAIATIPFLAGLFGTDKSQANQLATLKASLNATAERISHEITGAIHDRVSTLKTVALRPIDELQAGILAVSRQIRSAGSDNTAAVAHFDAAIGASTRTDAFVGEWLAKAQSADYAPPTGSPQAPPLP